MSIICQLCGKTPSNGNRVSHANNKTKRRWMPNLQTVRVRQANGTRKKLRVCTQCIRSGKTIAANLNNYKSSRNLNRTGGMPAS